MQLSDVVELLKDQGEIGQPPLRHSCDEMFVLLSREFHLQVVLVLVGSKDCVLQKLESLKLPVEEVLAGTLEELEERLKISRIRAELDVFVIMPEISSVDASPFAELLPLDQAVFEEELARFPGSRCRSVGALSIDDHKRLSEILFPKREWQRVTLAIDEGRLIRHDRRQELDRLQQQAAWGLGFETTIIEGGPGTGKSLVLISRALWLSNTLLDSKILLLTWNRSLADALGAWRQKLQSEMTLPNQGSIETLVFADFLKQQKIEISLSDPGDADRRCADLLMRTRFKPIYDAILIDEAQDVGGTLLKLVVQFIRPERGGLTLALDSSQNIRGRPPILQALLPQPSQLFRLEHSYRSTSSIQSFTETFGNRQIATESNQTDGKHEPVRLVWAESEEQCARMIVSESIRLIRNVGLKPCEIMVVCFSPNQRMRLKQLFGEQSVFTSAPGKVTDTTGILLASPEVAKGHEASCVFLLGWDCGADSVESFENDCRRFVAGSRAADMLYVVYSSQQLPNKIMDSPVATKQLWPDDFQIAT